MRTVNKQQVADSYATTMRQTTAEEKTEKNKYALSIEQLTDALQHDDQNFSPRTGNAMHQ